MIQVGLFNTRNTDGRCVHLAPIHESNGIVYVDTELFSVRGASLLT